MKRNEDNEKKLVRARLGIKIEEFLSSDIGKYIVSRADQERKLAIEDLKTADVTSQSEMIKLQQRAIIPGMVIDWLLDAVSEGRASEIYLKNEGL
jgi:hypothetical protein